jgi:hypothetical protein
LLNNNSNISEGKFNELKKILDKIPVSEFSKDTRDSHTQHRGKHGTANGKKKAAPSEQ